MCDKEKFHLIGNIKELCYNETTPEVFHCNLMPKTQDLHVRAVCKSSNGNVFSSKSNDNVTMCGGECHTFMKDNALNRNNAGVSFFINYSNVGSSPDNSSNTEEMV